MVVLVMAHLWVSDRHVLSQVLPITVVSGLGAEVGMSERCMLAAKKTERWRIGAIRDVP
jgi:hypothetical protein